MYLPDLETFAHYGTSRARIEQSLLDTYPRKLSHILDGKPFRPLLRRTKRGKNRTAWRKFFRDLISTPPSSTELSEFFHTQWHVCHHYVRALVEDDELLLDVLWVWLPRYQGGAALLYRGENIDRYEAGALGSAWTDKLEVAEMFAGGLNAVGKGGVVLRAIVDSSAIVAGPSCHSSNWLGENEFTVDTRKMGQLDVVATFPRGVAAG